MRLRRLLLKLPLRAEWLGSKILYISVCFLLRRITLNDARCELPLNPFHARSKVISQRVSFFLRIQGLAAPYLVDSYPPYIVKSFFLENQGFFSVSSINISEEGAIGMDISLYLVRK